MQVLFEIPDRLKQTFEREGVNDFPRAALEAFAAEGYRAGHLGESDVAEMLDMPRINVLEWLGRRGIPMNYSLEDLEQDRQTMERVFKQEDARSAHG